MLENDLSNIVIKNVSSATRIHSLERVSNKRVNRNLWAIAIKHIGKTEYYINGETIISDIENIVILPKGSSYTWCSFGSGEFLIIDFDADLTSNEICSFKISDATKLINIFYKIEHEKLLNEQLSNIKCIEWCYHMMVAILKSRINNYTLSSKNSIIFPAIDYIATNYSNSNISNEMLGQISGVSTVYLRKIFTEIYKISPMNYVHNLRMKKAVEILKTDHGSINDIAISVGYSNIYNFSKMFKKYYGCAPSKFK